MLILGTNSSFLVVVHACCITSSVSLILLSSLRGVKCVLSLHMFHAFPSYQINARTELAIRYNDISPLENHHCAVAFQILEKVCGTT